MKFEFTATSDLTDKQNDSLQQLRSAVYPPEVLATLPGKLFTWAPPQWSVLLWEEGELVSRVGLLTREIRSNGEAKVIGGIGGVMTHPNKQGRGYASRAMREAQKRFASDWNVDYALLFCRPHLVEFYQRLEWKQFSGQLYVEQPQGRIEFSANGAMVLRIKEQAPVNGTLDLKGLPW